MKRGSVKHWNLNRDFGFIVPDDEPDRDVFVHLSCLGEDLSQLAIGDCVTFEMATDRDGRPKAINVRAA